MPPECIHRVRPSVARAFALPDSRAAAQKLSESGIFASNGNFYALTVIEKFGLAEKGLVRAGCACYTTVEEVERLIDAVSAMS